MFTMILLRKSGKKSIRLEFDRAGAIELEAAFGDAPRSVGVLVDRALLGGRQARRGGFAESALRVSPGLDEEGMISIQPDEILIRIDADSAAYILQRLRACDPNGFFPSEMGELSLDEEGNVVSLYGEYNDALSPT